MVKRKTRMIGYALGISLLMVILIVYYTRDQKKELPLTQEEIPWNTKEELSILTEIENTIARAGLGMSEVITVGTTGTGYESFFPEMKAPVKEEEQQNSEEEKIVYLTFDDGPSSNTPKVLEILDRYNIKASFFVVSSNLTETGAEALRLTALKGHVIGMHSDSHDYKKIYSSVEGFLKDCEKVFTMIREETGNTPYLYRFPGGSYNKTGRACIQKIIPEMKRRGFIYFDWNVTAEDAVGNPTASSIRENIFKNLDQVKQPVILMHDGPSNDLTVKVLPEIIEELIRRGYRFDTLNHREQCYFNW